MKSKLILYDSLIGQRLKFYRKKRGLTQASLSAMIGISAQQLQKYEIGRNKISASRLLYMSELLDVPVQYFLMDPKENPKEQKLNNPGAESEVNKLLYYYSLVKSDKLRKLLLQHFAVYVENGL